MPHAPSHIGLGPRFPQAFVVATAAALDAVVLGGGGLLAVRRLTAAWHPPAAPTALVAVCVAGGLLVVAGDLARRASGSPEGRIARLGLLLAVAAVAIPWPARSLLHGLAAVVALAGVGAVAARPWTPRRGREREPRRDRRIAGVVEPEPAAALPPAPTAPPVMPGDFPGQVLQQFMRFTRADGVECVRGRLYLSVPAGVRSAAGHIGFCPPFPQTPSVEVTTDYDAVEAVVSAAEVLPWGVRVECRLDEPADDSFEIPIDITADASSA